MSSLIAIVNVAAFLIQYQSFHRLMHHIDSVTKRDVPISIRILVIAIILCTLGLLVYTVMQIWHVLSKSSVSLETVSSLFKIQLFASLCANAIMLPLNWLPVGLYTVICLYLYVCFRRDYENLTRFPLTKENLDRSFAKYHKAIKLTSLVDAQYAYIVMLEVGLTVLSSISGLYGMIKMFKSDAEDVFKSIYFGQVASNIGYLLLYLIPPVLVYEKAHEARVFLVSKKMEETETKRVKDEFLLLLNDRDWPLSFGHCFVIERGTLLSVTTLIISTLVIWLEFGGEAVFDCCVYKKTLESSQDGTALQCTKFVNSTAINRSCNNSSKG